MSTASDRRLGVRVPVELMLSAYVEDRQHRAIGLNLSDSGIYMESLPGVVTPERTMGLEFELPGTGEVIWARAEVAAERGGRYLFGRALHFSGIARAHARLVRDYCQQLRTRHLASLLERIRLAR
jgi:hypothetical protein